MLSYALVTLPLLPLTLAADPDFPIFCDSKWTGNCLQRVADSCYPCLHAVEFSCGGTGKEFDDCFCPILSNGVFSNTWTAFEKCINDPSTGCADAALGEHLIYNTFATECNQYNQFICQPGAKLDAVESKLAVQGYSCDATAAPTSSVPSSTGPAPTSTKATATGVSTTANGTSKPVVTSSCTTVPGAPATTALPATTAPPVIVSGAGRKDIAGPGLVMAIAAGVALL